MSPLTKKQRLVSWAAQIVVALILFQTLFFKFTAAEESVYIFTRLGLEPWGRIGSGVVELIAGVLLLIPATAALGALLALGTILGALAGHLTVLGIVVQGDGGLLFGLACLVAAGSALVLWLRRGSLPLLGNRLGSRAVLLFPLALAWLSPDNLWGELPSKGVLTLQVARRVAEAAETEALKRGARVVIAIVDDGGHVILLERLDDTQVASVEVGIGKARTAAIFRRPSKVFEDQVREGRIAALALPGATPLQGGIPIVHEGRTLGAIGVSGESPGEDEEIALAGAAAAAAAIREAR